jgi:hypothetical protein
VTSKPAKVLSGSKPDPAAKPAIPLTGSLAAGWQSLWVAWQPVSVAAMEADAVMHSALSAWATKDLPARLLARLLASQVAKLLN